VSKYQWLLFLHVTGAFVFIGAAVAAWVLGFAAARRERPSEIALLFRLTRIAGALFGIGLTFILVFGIWLAIDSYSITDGWILGALGLLVLALVTGGIAGGRDKRARMLAEQLARDGDVPNAELSAAVRDVPALVLNAASTLLAIAILVLMIYKPGAP
jgi:uncharacterized membrane protein